MYAYRNSADFQSPVYKGLILIRIHVKQTHVHTLTRSGYRLIKESKVSIMSQYNLRSEIENKNIIYCGYCFFEYITF